MITPRKILVFQTAFIGDVILTLPVAQVLRKHFPGAHIALLTIPSASHVIGNHPAVNEVITYDKRGAQRGMKGIREVSKQLRAGSFDLAVVPHRSLRSAVAVRLAGIPRRIGFSTSAGSLLFTQTVRYQEHLHEIRRNLSLLQPLGLDQNEVVLPELFPSAKDKQKVEEVLGSAGLEGGSGIIAIAPGSVWFTKRWPEDQFVALGKLIHSSGNAIVAVGGKEDESLCGRILEKAGPGKSLNAAGQLSLLQSGELIRRCRVLVSNDSAPMHLAVAMRTPVIAIFGATVPEFGFAPLGIHDEVVQSHGLACRPCSIHGGNKCPITTFLCMKQITPEYVFSRVQVAGGGERGS